MRRCAFTLIELLMVVMIMGILGTVTVGGYRAMQRGMEDRGVMENVNHFIRSAYRRAQIDRQPVAVFYWDELLRGETDTESLIVVGKAVAVRRAGRVTSTEEGGLCDEFADLDKELLVVDSDDLDDDGNKDSGKTAKADNLMAIYKMNSDGDCGRQLVIHTTKPVIVSDFFTSGKKVDIQSYAYVPADGAKWEVGDAYGFEFAEIQLPHGYTFGSEKLTHAGGEPNVKHLWFNVGENPGSPDVKVYCLRPNKAGELEPKLVDKIKSPKDKL